MTSLMQILFGNEQGFCQNNWSPGKHTGLAISVLINQPVVMRVIYNKYIFI